MFSSIAGSKKKHQSKVMKMEGKGPAWWPTPIIPVTLEVEIGRVKEVLV
jgi:hypothetical protein